MIRISPLPTLAVGMDGSMDGFLHGYLVPSGGAISVGLANPKRGEKFYDSLDSI